MRTWLLYSIGRVLAISILGLLLSSWSDIYNLHLVPLTFCVVSLMSAVLNFFFFPLFLLRATWHYSVRVHWQIRRTPVHADCQRFCLSVCRNLSFQNISAVLDRSQRSDWALIHLQKTAGGPRACSAKGCVTTSCLNIAKLGIRTEP